MEETSRGKDRISELPNDIKQHILSSLCMRDAVATSYLSPVWRYTWVTLPSFSFGFSFFEHFCNYFDNLPPNHPKKLQPFYNSNNNNHDSDETIKHLMYVQLLHQLLQIYIKKRQPLDVLDNLTLFVPNMTVYACDVVSQWISVAKHNVNKFNFSTPPEGGVRNRFNGILESKTITKLWLQGCSLITDTEMYYINLPCLKQLNFICFHYLDQKILDILLCKCGGTLEKLQLLGGEGVKVLRLSRLSKLKDLNLMHIHDLNRVEIDVTALEYLTLIKLKINKCKLRVTSNYSCNNLVELFINGCAISDDFFNNVAEFPRLKAVTLLDCPKLKCIKITSRCLKRLNIEDCPNLSQIELNASKMDFFRYSTTLNHNIITLLSKCQFVRTSLILQRPRGALFNPILWYSKLVAFLANFSQSTHLDLETNSKKVVIIPQELRERFCPPLSGVQNLTFILATSLMVHDVLKYADALLWFSPHPKTISFCSEYFEPALSLELQYEDRMTEVESCVCCRAHPTSCWRRVLKDFKIVYHRGLGNCDSIRKLLEHELKKRKATATAGELYCLTTLNT